MGGPLGTAGDGRSANGQFLPGNKLAKGNPHARRVNELRRMLLEAVSDQDLIEVVGTLVEQAKGGAPWAVKELLDRLLGKARTALALTDADGGPLALSMSVVQTVLLEALAPFPEARVAVAAHLQEMARGRVDGDGCGP